MGHNKHVTGEEFLEQYLDAPFQSALKSYGEVKLNKAGYKEQEKAYVKSPDQDLIDMVRRIRGESVDLDKELAEKNQIILQLRAQLETQRQTIVEHQTRHEHNIQLINLQLTKIRESQAENQKLQGRVANQFQSLNNYTGFVNTLITAFDIQDPMLLVNLEDLAKEIERRYTAMINTVGQAHQKALDAKVSEIRNEQELLDELCKILGFNKNFAKKSNLPMFLGKIAALALLKEQFIKAYNNVQGH